MFEVSDFDIQNKLISPQEAKKISDELQNGKLLDLAFSPPQSIPLLIQELIAIQHAFLDPSKPFSQQILASQEKSMFVWYTEEGEYAELLDLNLYPLLQKIIHNAVQVSLQMKTPGENLLLSIIPALQKTQTFPRFYHKDGFSFLDEKQLQGDRKSMYRCVWDLGLENSHAVINVNFVQSQQLLNSQGDIAEGCQHLFQQQIIYDFFKMADSEIDAIQKQMCEDMLPDRENQQYLQPGRAFVWLDDLFWHTVYLRQGRSTAELCDNPRSVMIIRDFRNNSYRSIPWPKQVTQLLNL